MKKEANTDTTQLEFTANLNVNSCNLSSHVAHGTAKSTVVPVFDHYQGDIILCHTQRSYDDDQGKPTDKILRKEYQKERDLLDLPHCLIENIAERLILLDYMNFRGVCRLFSSLAPTIQWRKALFPLSSSSSKEYHLTPWLMLSGGEGKEEYYTLVDTKFNGRYFIRVPTELSNATIHCSRKGWLIMSTSENSLFFFNPFTRVVRPCPNLPVEGVEIVCFRMSVLDRPLFNYFILGIKLEKGRIDLYYIYDGDERWEYCNEVKTEFGPSQNPAIWWQKSYMFLDQKGNLLQLDNEAYDSEEEDDYEELEWTFGVHDYYPTPLDSFHQNFFVECDGILHSIYVGDLGKWVRVFKVDLPVDSDTLIWKEIDSLGNQNIFLSRSSCFSVEVKSEEMGNRIYFPRLYKGSLIFYSLDTKKFHTADGKNSFTDYAGTTEQLQCCWIETSWN